MKKIQYYILIFALLFAMLGGVNFDTASSVVSPTLDEAISVEPPTSVPGDKEEEITEYTYKDFGYYYKDKDFSNITLTGTGTEADPYQVNSTEDFLALLAGPTFIDGLHSKEESSLPEEYFELEYIEAIGSQSLQIGINPTATMRFEMDLSAKTDNLTNSIYCTGLMNYGPGSAVQCGYQKNSTTNEYEYFVSIANKTYTFGEINENRHKFVIDLQNNQCGMDENIIENTTIYSNKNNWYLMLFAQNYGNRARYFYEGKLYSLKVYDYSLEEPLIRNLIPCMRKTDAIYGLYDLVNDKFYTSSTFNCNFNNKYLEFNSDVYLNDETFDKDGNAYGGDGIIYKWHPIQTGNSGTFINGNNHTLYSLYFNGNATYAGLFASFALNIENINTNNFYIINTGSNSHSLSTSMKFGKNITTHGYIIAKTYAGGVVSGSGNLTHSFENCRNYAYCSAQTAAGIEANSNTNQLHHLKYINCKNYGNIRGSTSGAGIVGKIVQRYTNATVIFKDCDNYGDIYGGTWSMGVYATRDGNHVLNFSNCKNYGKITGQLYVCGITMSATLLSKCKQFGSLKWTGSSANSSICELANSARIMECYVESVSGYPVCDWISDMRNTEINYLNSIRQKYIAKNSATSLTNVKINIYNCTQSLFINIQNSRTTVCKNVIINQYFVEGKNNISVPGFYTNGDGLIFEGKLFDGTRLKYYQGSNFSGFYTSWKTGKIGLISIDGRGNFQGEVNEDVLTKKGYTKIA